jgi:hypothetical protein
LDRESEFISKRSSRRAKFFRTEIVFLSPCPFPNGERMIFFFVFFSNTGSCDGPLTREVWAPIPDPNGRLDFLLWFLPYHTSPRTGPNLLNILYSYQILCLCCRSDIRMVPLDVCAVEWATIILLQRFVVFGPRRSLYDIGIAALDPNKTYSGNAHVAGPRSNIM